MDVVDAVVVAVLLVALVVGVRRGLLENLGVIVGFVVGGAAAYWLVPVIVTALPLAGRRAIATAVFVGALLLLGVAVGATIGHLLHRGVARTPLRGVERVLGGAVTVIVAALVLSFAASTVTLTGAPTVSAAVGSSRVIRLIDDLTPAPVEAGMSQLRAALLDDGVPRFSELIALDPATPDTPVDLDDPRLAAAAASVARISGTAYACGVSVTGSGFVVAPGRLVTNAHVVAGVASPLVQLPDGTAAVGTVVYFDPAADLAVVAVDGLAAAPLALGADLDAGDTAVVQGYPYGGPFATSPAVVLSRQSVYLPDIHGASSASREVYSLATEVRPGDSGGPLVDAMGSVAGVVFARGADDERQGYAMTDAELRPVAEAAAGLTQPVDTGSCVG